ncbi:7549_t:CDS:2 [Ambispora leptoticha]|uniref:7549_t:CDS:1 n=1 Tax=Ambispora leptoticha TaxID=144679 RepID=A0A9N9AQ45_9GLOM|nr:7549_t:CDS:2 [Ambispora leptoticha]
MAAYPPFHKYVTRAYFVLFAVLVIVLPLYHSIKKKPSVNQIIIIYLMVGFSYLIYWLLVRMNCYGDRISPPPFSNARPAPQSTTNLSTGTSNSYPTFANYRFANFRERLRRIASNRSAREDEEDMYHDLRVSVVQVPPPTYGSALSSDEGLPPPYQLKVNENNENGTQLESVITSNGHQQSSQNHDNTNNIHLQVPSHTFSSLRRETIIPAAPSTTSLRLQSSSTNQRIQTFDVQQNSNNHFNNDIINDTNHINSGNEANIKHHHRVDYSSSGIDSEDFDNPGHTAHNNSEIPLLTDEEDE